MDEIYTHMNPLLGKAKPVGKSLETACSRCDGTFWVIPKSPVLMLEPIEHPQTTSSTRLTALCAPLVLLQFVVMGRMHSEEDHHVEDGWFLLQRTIKIHLRAYLRVVVKLQNISTRWEGEVEDQQSTKTSVLLPHFHTSTISTRVVPHPTSPDPDTRGKHGLPVVKELTFRTVIPIDVIFLLKHSGR